MSFTTVRSIEPPQIYMSPVQSDIFCPCYMIIQYKFQYKLRQFLLVLIVKLQFLFVANVDPNSISYCIGGPLLQTERGYGLWVGGHDGARKTLHNGWGHRRMLASACCSTNTAALKSLFYLLTRASKLNLRGINVAGDAMVVIRYLRDRRRILKPGTFSADG